MNKQIFLKKEISSSELTEIYLKNIKENEDLNCFISLNENALDEAQKIDKLKNRKSSVQGIPIAHKDIFCAKGYKTTCGSKMLENFTSPYSSTVFDKLNTSKTIMLGKRIWMSLLWGHLMKPVTLGK